MTVTASAIQQVHALAHIDKMPAGLKASDKSGCILCNVNLTAVVDYVNDADEDSAASESNSNTSSDNNSAESDNSQQAHAEDKHDAVNLQTGNNLNTNSLDNHHAEPEVQVSELEGEEDAVEAIANILDENATKNEQEVPEEETNASARPQRTRRPVDRLCLRAAHMNNKKVQFSPEKRKSTNVVFLW